MAQGLSPACLRQKKIEAQPVEKEVRSSLSDRWLPLEWIATTASQPVSNWSPSGNSRRQQAYNDQRNPNGTGYPVFQMLPIETRTQSAHAEFPSFQEGPLERGRSDYTRISAEDSSQVVVSRVATAKAQGIQGCGLFNRHRRTRVAAARHVRRCLQAIPAMKHRLYRIDHHRLGVPRSSIHLIPCLNVLGIKGGPRGLRSRIDLIASG